FSAQSSSSPDRIASVLCHTSVLPDQCELAIQDIKVCPLHYLLKNCAPGYACRSNLAWAPPRPETSWPPSDFRSRSTSCRPAAWPSSCPRNWRGNWLARLKKKCKPPLPVPSPGLSRPATIC